MEIIDNSLFRGKEYCFGDDEVICFRIFMQDTFSNDFFPKRQIMLPRKILFEYIYIYIYRRKFKKMNVEGKAPSSKEDLLNVI